MLRHQDRRRWKHTVGLGWILAAALPLLILPGHANAQAHPQKAPGRIQVPTKFTPLSDSLETLLNGGAEIVAGSASELTLRKGDKWIICGLDDGRMSGRPPNSECYQIN